jgi:16S rRNA processing protein RimM
MTARPAAPGDGTSNVVLGRVTGAHGIQGWLRVLSYTDPPEALLDYPDWRLRRVNGSESPCQRRDAHFDGRVLRVALADVTDRNAAEELRGCEIVVPRTDLPPAGEREYYQEDLIGFDVVNTNGTLLGSVSHFVAGAAHPLVVVRGEQERWIPAAPPYLRRVELARRVVVVDWPDEF